jgi:hypothetical protein
MDRKSNVPFLTELLTVIVCILNINGKQVSLETTPDSQLTRRLQNGTTFIAMIQNPADTYITLLDVGWCQREFSRGRLKTAVRKLGGPEGSMLGLFDMSKRDINDLLNMPNIEFRYSL